jgi:hypothetical protein
VKKVGQKQIKFSNVNTFRTLKMVTKIKILCVNDMVQKQPDSFDKVYCEERGVYAGAAKIISQILFIILYF